MILRIYGVFHRNTPVLRNTCSNLIKFHNEYNIAQRAQWKCFHSSKIMSQTAKNDPFTHRKKTISNYVIALGVITLGSAYAAVPLYRIFCQNTGFGGTVQHDQSGEKVKNMQKVTRRPIKVMFNSDLSASLAWQFKPQQREIEVYPGETALAFYTATNPTDRPITGISTYNVLPFEAGAYFNKIQCFCFEEQRLNPHEKVDMPVFFYIDPEFVEDPKMQFVNEVILSYTFFEAKEGLKLPVPSFAKKS